jgi:hypothetical protein
MKTLMDNFSGSSKYQKGYINTNNDDWAHKVSGEYEESIDNWMRGHSCYSLENNFYTFCPCPETLWETEFQGNGLINLVEAIPRQDSI